MKNKIKEIIKNNYKFAFMFILGIIVAGGGVYAATVVSGSTVTYDNSTSGLSSTNVQDAVDELSGKADTSSIKTLPNIIAAYEYSTATATMCKTGEESTCVATYCYTKSTSGSCKPGTIIKYKVNDSEIKTFNVISDKGDTIDMQSIDKIGNNIWTYSTNANGPVHSMELLNGSTKTWTNVNDQSYYFGNYGPNSSCSAYDNCSCGGYELTVRGKARMITVQEAASLGCSSNYDSCPEWLPYTRASSNYREKIWTMNTVCGTTDEVWVISHYYNLEKWSLDDYDVAMKAVVNINKPV